MTTLEYAKSEFKKYYQLVTNEENAEIELISLDSGDPFADEIDVDIVEGKGFIKANNPRALLIGVYKFFYELGCRFLRPGKNGEILVRKTKADCTVRKSYRPENLFRGVCSEGAISEEHIIDMVEWLPKVGMNSYFTQFTDGHLFFEKWYKHKGNSLLEGGEYSVAESIKHYAGAVEAIKKCGLIFQAVGHGWTTLPMGYITYGDTRSTDKDILPEHREFFAELNGVRGFFQGNNPGDTHLCYSNPTARDIITDAIVNYLKDHSEVDVLHFWLADGVNNHCECVECQKMLPSDWYVTMLNELDEKLTVAGIDTKIVFLIYCDLLFAPERVQLKHPERFLMMYAPIARNFFQPLYTEENFNAEKTAPSYVRNKNNHPSSPAEYLYYLEEWQKKIHTKGFVFDYHLMTFQYGGDPSFITISETLYTDMKNISKTGLNGNVSCQLQRVFTPTSLPVYAMAEMLFGSKRSFKEIENENYKGLFGRQWVKIRNILKKMQSFFLSETMTGRKSFSDGCEEVRAFSKDFKEKTKKLYWTDGNETVALSLRIFKYFTEMMNLFLETLILKAEGKNYEEARTKLNAFIDKNEMEFSTFDDALFRKEGFLAWIA